MASQASLAVHFLESENCFPHVPHLEPYPHHRGPLDVVGLGEGRPPTTEADVPDNGLDPMVNMVPVRGGRVAPPINVVISFNPAVGAFMSVYATAAVEGTAVARAPAWRAASMSALIRAAATMPLGVRGCPLRRLLPRCLPHQLELIVSVIIGRNRAADATSAQSLELCRSHTCCIRHRYYFCFCPCCCQFHHCQPCRPCRYHCSLCRRSLAFLCRDNLSLLPVLHARGDRALRLSFEHGTLMGGCYVGKRLPQMSVCVGEEG
jgi:hypothetical protein